MGIRTILLALTALLGGHCLAADRPVIVVLGDSLSANYGLDAQDGWVALLQRRLDALDQSYRVINASISGETTRGAVARIDALLAAHRPQWLIIALGANDGLRGLPLAAMESNLATLVEHARAKGAKILLIGMRLPPNYGSAYTQAFETVYRTVAARYGVGLVPFLLEGFAAENDYFQADGLHPTADAQPLMLDNVWRYLEPLLTTPGQERPAGGVHSLPPSGAAPGARDSSAAFAGS